jgi:dihydropteroate synthase
MAQRLLAEGADIIDIGGCSTRPGSDSVSELQEMERVHLGISVVRELSAEVMISVDTFRSTVAARSIEWGADIINDISAGLMDEQMIPTVAQLGVPYIMMHTRGTPDTMGSLTDYPDGVVVGVASELREQVVKASLAGIGDIIIDPGLGFAKTAAQNYELLAGTRELQMLLDNRPILIGLSRKSMIYKPLGITPADSLPGTIALNAIALELGAAIIRVHDVAPARQTVAVMSQFPSAEAD